MSSAYPSPQIVEIKQDRTSLASSAASNYGTVGDAPKIAGATLFPEATGYRYYDRILFGAAIVMGVVGLLMGRAFGGAAWLFVLFLPIFGIGGLIKRRTQVHVDCVCDDQGITVRSSSRKGMLPPVRLPWRAITLSACGNMTKEAFDPNSNTTSQKNYQAFGVSAPGIGVFNTDETKIKGLPALIALTNKMTPQLPYQWVPAKQAKGLPVLTKGGKYVKVAR